MSIVVAIDVEQRKRFDSHLIGPCEPSFIHGANLRCGVGDFPWVRQFNQFDNSRTMQGAFIPLFSLKTLLIVAGVRQTRSEVLIPSGSEGEFRDERVRDGPTRREGDARLGGLETGCGDVIRMRLDGGRREIEATLLAERCVARDDGFSNPESRHLIGDDFFSVRQGARELSAQSNEQRAQVFRSPGDVRVVIGKHGQNTLPLA